MFNNSLSLLKKQEIDYLINNLESYKINYLLQRIKSIFYILI